MKIDVNPGETFYATLSCVPIGFNGSRVTVVLAR